MDVHFCGVASGKGIKNFKKFTRNTQIFLVISLLILLDLLHQPRTQLTENDLEHFRKQSTFFSNYINKASFGKISAEKLQKNGLNVIQCPRDTYSGKNEAVCRIPIGENEPGVLPKR